LRLHIEQPLARIAGEGAERSEAGEGTPVPSVWFAPPVPDPFVVGASGKYNVFSLAG
jgi:hypothetical protein